MAATVGEAAAATAVVDEAAAAATVVDEAVTAAVGAVAAVVDEAVAAVGAAATVGTETAVVGEAADAAAVGDEAAPGRPERPGRLTVGVAASKVVVDRGAAEITVSRESSAVLTGPWAPCENDTIASKGLDQVAYLPEVK